MTAADDPHIDEVMNAAIDHPVPVRPHARAVRSVNGWLIQRLTKSTVRVVSEHGYVDVSWRGEGFCSDLTDLAAYHVRRGISTWKSVQPPKTAGKTVATVERPMANTERIADLVYGLLRESEPHLGIDLVRPPNPAHGNAVAVLFQGGQDVVISFAECKRVL